MKLSESLQQVIAANIAGKPKGGERYRRLLERATEAGEVRLFVPWAAPPAGRGPGKQETQTLEWLGDLAGAMGELLAVRTLLMPADSYAARNGYDMTSARSYWQSVAAEAKLQLGVVEVVKASDIEQDPRYTPLLAAQAYAFERLPSDAQRQKIMASATKYTGAQAEAAYESAACYAMRRAAEADFVAGELDALWVGLNYPERDIMCGDVPRVYAPEALRTPWLKEL